jgi:hypothetical protein
MAFFCQKGPKMLRQVRLKEKRYLLKVDNSSRESGVLFKCALNSA